MPRIGKILLLLPAAALFAGCAAGLSAFNKAEKLERDGNLDEAVVKYAEAMTANPDVAEYRVRYLKASETAARVHMKKGDEALDADKYDDAIREYGTAFAMDSSLARARQQADLATKLRNARLYYQEGVELEKNRKVREAYRSYQQALNLNPDLKEAKEAKERLLASKKPKMDGYELNVKSNKPITLKFKEAKVKEVFNILSQLSGINFVFDEAMKDSNVTVYLENATFQQALEILCGINKLGKKVLNESTIILYPKNPEKTKQYEELMVETFYLNKLDAKKAVNLIRTMLQVRKIYVNEEMNALVLRDTPDVIEVTRKILEANDVPDAEVVLEVEVVEISKNDEDKFGLALSRYAIDLGVTNPSGNFFSDTLNTTQTTNTGVTGQVTTTTQANTSQLLNLFASKGYNGFITVPNATYSFGKTLSNAETLANPKMRIKNREKAKFNVGQRVPITTTSSPVGGGVSVNVQYVDVGVKMNAEPTIQLSNDVSIKVSLEVSSIINREVVGGVGSATTVVTIGTRNLDTVLNLRDGETSIIGGLIQNTSSKSKQKVFLVGDIPLIGPLLSNNDNTTNKSELVLAITPHIVRGITIPEPDVASFWSGKEDEPTVGKLYQSFEQEPELALPATGTIAPGTATPAAPGAALSPKPVAPAETPAPTPSGPVVPVPSVPSAPPASVLQPRPSPAEKPAVRTTLRLVAPSAVNLNEQFTVEVRAADVNGLASAPFVLQYDPIFVEFVKADEGGLMKQDGKTTTYQASDDKNTGRVTVSIVRSKDAGGVSGTGALLTATFKARNRGPASFGLSGAGFLGVNGLPQDVVPYNTAVEVK